MSLLGTRRAAEELSRALDGDRAGVSPGTASLLALGDRLRLMGGELEAVAVPREDFRAALRTRLVAVASVQPVGVQPVAPVPVAGVRGLLSSRGQRTVGVAAGALASVVAVSGVAVASTQALPGDPFYGVKRTAEALQLQLAGDDVEEGDRHLQFAATRLDEVRELALGRDVAAAGAAAADADWALVRETLADMDDETRKGSSLLERVWLEDRDPDALALLSEFAAEQAAELQALLPVMAADVRADAEASLGLVTRVAADTSERLGLLPCTETCSSGGSAAGSGDSDCDCGGTPSSSPRPSASPSPSPTGEPSTAPSGSATSSGPTAPEPDATSSPAPPPAPPTSPAPLPSLPSLPPAPSSLPSVLPTDVTAGLPSVTPTSPLPLPVPTLSPVLDDLGPG